MWKTALITWASSWIGEQFAYLHAATGGDLVLLARRKERLRHIADQIQSTYGVSVEILIQDLAEPDAPAKIHASLKEKEIQIDYLINNAWFGGAGTVADRERNDDKAMIEVNISALTGLTHLLLPEMLAKGSWRILHVASVAGFMPGPYQAVYFATKAYVLSFSQAVSAELKDTDITSTCLCPGATKTEFFEKAEFGQDQSSMASAQAVAKTGYEAMLAGKRLAIHGRTNRFLTRCLLPFLPTNLVLKMAEKFNRQ